VADAEDVLQTVFMKLVRNVSIIDTDRDVGAYLRRAAVNAALDLLRARKRSRSVAIDEVDPGSLHSTARDPEENTGDAQVREILRRALGQLSPRSAEAFALKYFEGYEHVEIAEVLGTSPMVISVILHRARARVRKLAGQLIEDSYI